ncbi:MAG: alcohol dehydrogenase [Firmicutes bacterium HGW-Firmicutes-16]|nr:MAG: alcohol dehydrogenase [Firmicutes bacterium HGW-Firmicutes-16]
MWTLKKAWYRTFQFVFNICEVFLPQHSPELLTGAGSIKKLPAFIKSKGIDKVLIVTDTVLSKIGLLNSLFAACDEAKLSYVLYDGAEVNPSIECIEKAYKAYCDNKCQGFIAFGGGSSMDCAKAAAARVARPKRSVAQLGGTLKVLKKVPTLFAVPTTAGTGSEATLAAVVTDYSTHHKYAIQDPVLLPRFAVLDPELTVGLPPHVTSTTGMDALTHSVEAYTNKFAPKYTRILAEKSTKLIFENLEKAYADGKNLEARSNMLLASFYGGRAFSRACVGNVHAIAHTLGGLYGTPHGLANAIILPYVMEDFGPAVYKPLACLADIVGIKGNDDGEKARAFIAAIHQMNKNMNIPAQIDVIKDKDVPQMVEWAMKEANPIYPVPVIWDEEQFTKTINRLRNPVTEEATIS